MKNFTRLGALLFLVVFAAGCGFEKPLTSGPSKSINTWLLGVWEHRDDKDKLLARATVLPRTSGSYWIIAEKLGTPKRTYRFEAWISRVGRANLLTLKTQESPGDPAPGTFAFLHYQLLDQLHVRIRVPKLDAAPDASGFQLRKEVRDKWKAGTLFPEPGTNWKRVSEVYWSGVDEPQPFQPLRFPAN